LQFRYRGSRRESAVAQLSTLGILALMTTNLDHLTVKLKSGDEAFHDHGTAVGYALADFWRWSVSDLVSNATRGRLAEFIVAKALGISIDIVRDEWQAFDLETSAGLKIEVKSAAYIQSWKQRTLSSIQFLTRKTSVWNQETNETSEAKWQADVYVFALLAHQDKLTIDPLDVRQWQFYVLPTRVLDGRERSQHSITLKTLEKLSGKPVDYFHLADAVRDSIG
jgi:hypothetical protein